MKTKLLFAYVSVGAGLVWPRSVFAQPAAETPAAPEAPAEPKPAPQSNAEPSPSEPASAPAGEAQAAAPPAAPAPEPIAGAAPAAAPAGDAPTAQTAPAGDAPAAQMALAGDAPAAPSQPTFGGSFWTRYELRSGYADHGLTHPRLHREGDYFVSRARLSVTTPRVDIGDGSSVYAKFAPQAAYTFGENTGPAPTISDHPAVAAYEAYAALATPHADLQVGRFMMDYGDALVIGNLGWNEAARAFNGARLSVRPGATAASVDLFATLINEGRLITAEPVSGDVYFYGAYASLGPMVAKKLALDVYVLGRTTARESGLSLVDPNDPTVTVAGNRPPATFVTLGARAKDKLGPFDYRAEAGVQLGKRSPAPTFAAPAPAAQDRFGYQLDAEFGVTPVKMLRVGVEGLIASGDDLSTADRFEGYDELYPTGHKFLGFDDVIGPRTNVVSGVLHVKVTPLAALKLSEDAHLFARPEAGADGKDGLAGEELDTQAAYAIGGGMSVRAMYGLFLPNSDFWETKATSPGVAGDPIHYFELQFGIELK